MSIESPIHINGTFCEFAPDLLAHLIRALPDDCVQALRLSSAPSPCLAPAPIQSTAALVQWRVDFSCGTPERAAVLGQSAPQHQPLLTALVRSALREYACQIQIAESQRYLNDYAMQVTSDFEELAWLRSLAEQFEYCDVRNTMDQLTERLLPSLREILHASAVEYIPADPQADALAEPETYNANRDGAMILTASECLQLVERFGKHLKNRVVVLNANSSEDFHAAYPNVRNCLIAHLGSDAERLGWIVALNREADEFGMLPGREQSPLMGEDEFGTFEAGLLRSVATLLVTHGRNLGLVEEKDSLLIGAIRSLINAIDAKDPYTFGHSDRVAMISRRLAVKLGLDENECQEIYMTGLLHDIGKIGIPDAILCKPGKLTDEEFELIKQHPRFGYQILKHLKQLQFAMDGVLHHHEAYNGDGYPAGLAGENIPLVGRILAVADAYDAMTSNRPYRSGMPTERAERILREGAGIQWDPEVVGVFFEAIEDVRSICADYNAGEQVTGGTMALDCWSTPSMPMVVSAPSLSYAP